MNLPPKSRKHGGTGKEPVKAKPKKAVHAPTDDDNLNTNINEAGQGSRDDDDVPGKKSKLASVKESIKRPLSSLLRRPASRSGSRDRGESMDQDFDNSDQPAESIESAIKDTKAKDLSPSHKPAKKMGGWGNGDVASRPSTATGRRFSMGRSNSSKKLSYDEEGKTQMAVFGSDSSGQMIELKDDYVNSEIVDNSISQLEEKANVDFASNNVAQAPNISVNRVATFRELDNMLLKSPAFSSLEGDFDLSILAKSLCPEREIKEEDVAWTWDYLFTSMSSELRKEWESQRPDSTSTAVPANEA